MKILLLFLTISASAYCQDNMIGLDTVIQVPNVDKNILFAKANEWAAERFNSSKAAVQLSDKESGTLLCKGSFLFEWGKSMTYGNLWGYINYTLTVKFKDDKIRIVVKGFNHETEHPGNMISVSLGPVNTGEHPVYGNRKTVKKYWAALQTECYNFCRTVSSDIYRYVSNTEDDEW